MNAREAGVEHRAGLVLHALGQIDVMVPRMVVGVGDLRPDDFDDARAGFDQRRASRQLWPNVLRP